MIVKTKILNKEINTPELKYAKNGDAGIDLTATSKWYDDDGNACYGTNRAFEIPKGFVGLQVGDCIRLETKVDEDMDIYVGNIRKFTALPGTEKESYAVRITSVVREED